MKIENFKNKKYKGVGFVEALIAIAVAGIASIVLMSIAINTTNQVLRNDIESDLTEQAIEASAMVKKIANSHNAAIDEDLFPPITGNEGSCFAIDGTTNDPSFPKSAGSFDVACRYDSGDRESCQLAASEDPEIFRVFCILPDSVISSGLVVGKVVTGLTDCAEGDEGGKCDVNDYEYYLGVKVQQ